MLLPPVTLALAGDAPQRRRLLRSAAATTAATGAFLALLLVLSHRLAGSWKFLDSTYGCM